VTSCWRWPSQSKRREERAGRRSIPGRKRNEEKVKHWKLGKMGAMRIRNENRKGECRAIPELVMFLKD